MIKITKDDINRTYRSVNNGLYIVRQVNPYNIYSVTVEPVLTLNYIPDNLGYKNYFYITSSGRGNTERNTPCIYDFGYWEDTKPKPQEETNMKSNENQYSHLIAILIPSSYNSNIATYKLEIFRTTEDMPAIQYVYYTNIQSELVTYTSLFTNHAIDLEYWWNADDLVKKPNDTLSFTTSVESKHPHTYAVVITQLKEPNGEH